MLIDDLAWNSRWRRCNISYKLIACISTGAAALIAKSLLQQLLVFLLCGVVVFLSLGGSVWRRFVILRRLWCLPLLFVLAGLLPFFIEIGSSRNGDSVAFTLDNLALVQLLAGRSLGVYASVMLFAVTTPIVDLLDWMARCRLPGTLLTLLALVYRQIFQLNSSFRRLISAAELRGGFRGFRRTTISLGMLMGSVFSSSMRQTESMSRALECRLYDGSSDICWPVRKIGALDCANNSDLTEVGES